MHRNTLVRHARFARTSAEGGGGGLQAGNVSIDGNGNAAVTGTLKSGSLSADIAIPGQQQTGEVEANGVKSATVSEWDGKVESLPEPVQKMIRDLRTESAERRTRLTAAEQAQQDAIRALAKAAGIELPGDEQPDPNQLSEQLAQSKQQARQAAVELAVYRTASKHQGDPDALLDSRSFLSKVSDLDPTADDFAAQVDAAIKATVDANPKLKAGRAPGASGADHAGGSGEGPRKPASLEEAVALKLGT